MDSCRTGKSQWAIFAHSAARGAASGDGRTRQVSSSGSLSTRIRGCVATAASSCSITHDVIWSSTGDSQRIRCVVWCRNNNQVQKRRSILLRSPRVVVLPSTRVHTAIFHPLTRAMASIGAGRATVGTMNPRLVIRTNSRVPAPPRLVVRAESQVPGDGKGKDDGQRRRQSGGRQYGGEHSAKSSRGFSNAKRRKGRAAHLRSPDDTPLRDGNRDRLMGLLTERAAKTLLYYMFETNPTLYGWFNTYLKVRCMSSTLDSRLSILDVCPTLSLSSCALRSFTRSLVRSFAHSLARSKRKTKSRGRAPGTTSVARRSCASSCRFRWRRRRGLNRSGSRTYTTPSGG